MKRPSDRGDNLMKTVVDVAEAGSTGCIVIAGSSPRARADVEKTIREGD